MDFLLWLLIGALAGWLAGKFTQGGGFGIFGNLLLGMVGALVGGFLFGLLGLASTNRMGSLVTATVGAIAFLSLLRWIRRS